MTVIKSIIESVIPKDTLINPKRNTVCLYKNESGEYIPIKILSGSFYINGRVSNFWYWINLNTNEKESGYGDFYKIKAGEE